MASQELVNFEMGVDRLVQAYWRDVYGALDNMKSTVKKRAELLQKQICALKGPGDVPEKDINLIVFQIINSEAKDLKNAISVQMKFRADSKGASLKPNGLNHGGSIMDL
jgi:hypothetical protein